MEAISWELDRFTWRRSWAGTDRLYNYSVSRGITSVLINAKMKRMSVCCGKYNTSLIPWVCIYDFVDFNLRLWRIRVAAFSISRCRSTRPSYIFYFQHFFIKIKYSIVLNLVFYLTGTVIVFSNVNVLIAKFSCCFTSN